MKLAFRLTRAQIVLCLGAFLLTVLSGLFFRTAPSAAQSGATIDSPPIEIAQ